MKKPNCEPLTVEMIKQAIEEYDRIFRNRVLVINPVMKEQLLEAYPKIEDRIVVIATDMCDFSTAYLMDRSEVEQYIGGMNT